MKKFILILFTFAIIFSLSVSVLAIDTSNITEIYRNSFDDDSALSDFRQASSTWKVYNGRLYMKNATDSSGLLLYNGDGELYELSDYVLDVDMYGTQTQAGVVVRSNHKDITYVDSNSFAGYFCFISYDGMKAAIGLGAKNGSWGGNLKVSGDVLTPCSNVHIQVAVKGNEIQYVLTDIGTGFILWSHTQQHSDWSHGTFGFRMTKKEQGELSNLLLTSFDNLVISKFNEDLDTDVSMTVGKRVAFVNGKRVQLDTAPIIKESRTMLPVRFVAENLHATVGWDGGTQTVSVKTDEKEINITIGKTEATVNGESVVLDSPAFIENDRTYLPVRFIAESLGATVGWDGATSTATISRKFVPKEKPVEEKPEHCEWYVQGVTPDEMATFFSEVCVYSEAEPTNNPYIKKWLGPIFYTYSGYYTEEDIAIIEEIAEYLNTEVDGFPGMYEAGRGDPVNLTFTFCEQAKIGETLGFPKITNVNGLAVCYSKSNTKRMSHAKIGYGYDLSPAEMRSVILEEIYNAVGVGWDTGIRSNSLIYEYYTEAKWLSPEDESILKMLYTPYIKCGMSAAQSENAIQRIYY